MGVFLDANVAYSRFSHLLSAPKIDLLIWDHHKRWIVEATLYLKMELL